MKSFAEMCCGQCGIEFHVPEHFYNERRITGDGWYCPNGHSRAFKESDVERLRRELQRTQQRLAEKDDAITGARKERDAAERRAAAARGQVTKLKNRVANGVCPCCSRHFTNLERHMTTKHPGFSNVVPLVEKSA